MAGFAQAAGNVGNTSVKSLLAVDILFYVLVVVTIEAKVILK